MKTFLPKVNLDERKWHVVDADGVVLGRLAVQVADILRGKNKPVYTPHLDAGDFVVVVNAEKVRMTGNKGEAKTYPYYTQYPSGYRTPTYKEMMAKRPEKVVELAVKRMLPKSAMGKQMLKKLKVYKGGKHEHQAQQPVKLEI
jgi:large subunit ribosomal protein L13